MVAEKKPGRVLDEIQRYDVFVRQGRLVSDVGYHILKISAQLSGFSEHEMNNPLALCELAARTPNISAGHMVKQACFKVTGFSYWIFIVMR
ncbi:MAG: hypothetical protein DRJ13_16410 [Bacteroidetes bacterium]|nr:MAG: hypothetical protein DRJ13_16410 [Bacteroidota bacterium]